MPAAVRWALQASLFCQAHRETDGTRGRDRARESVVPPPGSCVRYCAASARRRAVHAASSGSRARRTAAWSFVEPAVDAGFDVMVPVALPAVAQPAHRAASGGIAGDHGATVAERAQVLRRVEAERAGMRSRADRNAASLSPDAPGSSLPRSPAVWRSAMRADGASCLPPARRGAPGRSPSSAA